jgi:hypothetical protein
MSDTPRTDNLIASLSPLGFRSGVATEAEIKLARLCGDLEHELAAALKAKEEAETRVKVLEDWAKGPNGVKWYIARLEEAEQVITMCLKALVSARGALIQVSPCASEECQQDQKDFVDWGIKTVDAAIDAAKEKS